MNINNLKQMMLTAVFGLTALLGMSGAANAQNNRQPERREPPPRIDNQRQRNYNGERELERMRLHQEYLQQDVIEQQRIDLERIEQQREENRLQNHGNRYRVFQNDREYQMDYDGAELLKQAVNTGYQQGYQTGKDDHHDKRNAIYSDSVIYQNGNYGYENYVDASLYQYYFREGFRRGYEDGFSNQHLYGKTLNGIGYMPDAMLQAIVNPQQF